jgi:hypothetical protein
MRCPAGKLSTVLAAWHPPSGEAGLLLHRDVQHSAKESGRSASSAGLLAVSFT